MAIDVFEHLSREAKNKRRKEGQPSWISPMLARLTDEHFSDPGWLFERKLDGERVLAFIEDGKVTLKSRNRKDLNGTYPQLVEALERRARVSCVLDGEAVAFEGKTTSFSKLQQILGIKDPEKARKAGVSIYYYLFDCVFADGYDLSKLGLEDRKGVLKKAVRWDDPIRFTSHRNEEGEEFLREACRKGWEGLIAKDRTGEYVRGRSGKWLKFKCVARQELVIGGWTEPRGERVGFGALLMGYYREDKLTYAGKVGTGYDDEFLECFSKKLKGMERKTSPFADNADERGAHWVTPKYVAEVGFTEWTGGGKLRHPRFLGLRRDKDPKEVIKEEPGAR
jgi:DNA ligase D-like protein (predicted ligase)